MQIDEFAVKRYPALEVDGVTDTDAKIRVCIATEEIAGPVRNGGIASTYYHLARGLAARGHEVHVLYLKGRKVENETPEHWVDHFQAYGVTLHYLDFEDDVGWGPALNWQKRYAAAYRWFRDREPFDVVHTSEWRGGLIYVLMAKYMGLAFQETLFIVKTSSPHIWNRHYQMEPIDKQDLLTASYAEQKCVELADIVVGGSAHLLSFMEHIGYRMPAKNVHVQPNIVDFSEIKVNDLRASRQVGDVVKSDEMTFFGRLEARKGLEIFCNALDILASRQTTPRKVNFLGKFGNRLPRQGEMKLDQYLAQRAQSWPFSIELITNLDQSDALSFLCSRDMIAVMPSLIENSTMAVYEALENRLAFIATAVGGTPELIDEDYHEQVLVEPTSYSVADRLEQILKDGQVVPAASFSNSDNLDVWFGFHGLIADKIAGKGRREAIAELIGAPERSSDIDRMAVICLVRDVSQLGKFADALLADRPDEIVLVVTDANVISDVRPISEMLGEAGIKVELLEAIGLAAGTALNRAIASTSASGLIICDDATVRPKPGFCQAARTSLTSRPDCLMTSFFDADDGSTGMPIGGDIASQFVNGRAYGPEFVAMTRQLQQKLGEFVPYDVQYGLMHEYITRAVTDGQSDLLVFAESMLDAPTTLDGHRKRTHDGNYNYLKAKALLDNSDLAVRKILLATVASGVGLVRAAKLRDQARPKDKVAWLVLADKDRFNWAPNKVPRFTVGLDEERSILLFFAEGPGERRVIINDKVVETTTSKSVDFDNRQLITLDEWTVPRDALAASEYQVHFSIEHGDEVRKRFLRIVNVSSNVCAALSSSPIVARSAIQDYMDSKVLTHLAGGDSGNIYLDATPPKKKPRRVRLLNFVKKTARKATKVKDQPGSKAGAAPDDTGGPSADKDPAVCSIKVPPALAHFAELDWDAPGEGTGKVCASTPGAPADGAAIGGWAWDQSDPERILTVVALADGKPVAAVKANHFDEAAHHDSPAQEGHAFRLSLPRGIEDLDVPIELRVLETRQLIDNGQIKSASAKPE